MSGIGSISYEGKLEAPEFRGITSHRQANQRSKLYLATPRGLDQARVRVVSSGHVMFILLKIMLLKIEIMVD